MPVESYANNYSSALDGAIDNSQTTFDVLSATGAPAVNFRIKVENEIMLVTGVSSLTFTVARGQESTSAASHADGTLVTHILTATALNAMTHGLWTDYTPTWTAVTTNPTLGSTTINGRYKLLDSTTGVVRIQIVITTGGAWNAGSGEYKFSLPSGWTAATGRPSWGSAHVLDNGTTHFAGVCQIQSGATLIHPVLIADASGSKVLANNVPIATFATLDAIDMEVLLELA
jgi:hypothetical protein